MKRLKQPWYIEAKVDEVVLRQLRTPVPMPECGSLEGHILTMCFVPHDKKEFGVLRDIAAPALVRDFYTEHAEQDTKREHAFIFADCHEHITGAHVRSVHVLGYDIDGTMPLNEVVRRLEAFGSASVLHTTHTHHKSCTVLKEVEAESIFHARIFRSSLPATDAECVTFCKENARYHHLKNVRFSHEGKLTRIDGVLTLQVEHDPLDKTRALIFLKAPVFIAEVGLDGYRALYQAIGDDLFGRGIYDGACKNANRLHYPPTKSVGSTVQHTIKIIDGSLLDWRDAWSDVQATIEAARLERELRQVKFADKNLPALDAIAAALQAIPPTLSYHDWFRAIAAIHNETSGSDEGLQLAHAWSSGAPALYDEDEVERLWDHLDNSDAIGARVTIGTLNYLAKAHDPTFKPLRPSPRQATSRDVAAEYARIAKQGFEK